MLSLASIPNSFRGRVGTYGANPGDGTGILGVGTDPLKGVALYVNPGNQDNQDGEGIGQWVYFKNVPTGPAGSTNGFFGLISFAVWGGSQNSSTYGQLQGMQSLAQVVDTASLKQVFGADVCAQTLATGGTITECTGLYAHVESIGTGTITNAYGLVARVLGTGPITTCKGVKIASGWGTTVYGLYVDDQTDGSTNYAIYTNTGAVRFGDAVTAPSATFTASGTALTVSHGLLFENIYPSASGTAGAPSYAIRYDDLDTGMYQIGGNAIGWSCGGTERARLTTALFQVSGSIYVNGAFVLGNISEHLYLDCPSGKQINFRPNGSSQIANISSVGLEVSGGTIAVKSYTVGTLPTPGSTRNIAYASNGRKSGEGSGSGTGIPVWSDGSNWKTYYDNATVAA